MKKVLAILMALSMVLCGLASASAMGMGGGGGIVILYTNDAHCAIDDNLGYASVAGLKEQLEAEGKTVFLVDAGDAVQGGPVGKLSKGAYITDIMNAVGYDVAVPGNHEFDYGMARFLELKDKAAFPYVSCNFTDLATGESVLPAYQIVEAGMLKIAFVGVSTPKTFTSSSPAYFQNDAGEWIYDFQQDATGEKLYACVQKAVDAARGEGAMMVILLAHLGIDATCAPWQSSDVILNTTGVDAVIDGHSHSTIAGDYVKNKNGEDVLLTSTGTKIAAIGRMDITMGKFETSLITENAPVSDYARGYIDAIKSQYTDTLNTVVAHTDVDLVVNDPATDVRIVRVAETNLGDLCADGYRALSGADIAWVNGGGVRAKIAAGDITYGQILNVHPFGNAMCVVEATGQEIIDALEMGARAVPNDNGGFLQVSGLSYEIHTYIESTVELDDKGLFKAVAGERRVKNVQVAGAPIELDKTYTLASHNFMLKNSGDGINMFADNVILQDEVMLDNQVLISYIIDVLGGTVGAEYADPYGQGRIVAVPQAQ